MIHLDGCRSAGARDGSKPLGACGALVLLSDHQVIPNSQTSERRQTFVETADAVKHQTALVLGFVHASSAFATALGHNETAFARGESQVWMFKPLSSTDIMHTAPGYRSAKISPELQQGWLDILLSSVGLHFTQDSVAAAARSRLFLQGHPVHESLVQTPACLQTAAFGICDPTLLADSDGLHHLLPAVRSTNELQQSLMQLSASQARLATTQGAAINPVSGERWTMLEAAVIHMQAKRVSQYLKLEPSLVNFQGRFRQPLLHLAILSCRDAVKSSAISSWQATVDAILRSPSLDIELRDRWGHTAGMIALKL